MKPSLLSISMHSALDALIVTTLLKIARFSRAKRCSDVHQSSGKSFALDTVGSGNRFGSVTPISMGDRFITASSRDFHCAVQSGPTPIINAHDNGNRRNNTQVITKLGVSIACGSTVLCRWLVKRLGCAILASE